MTIGIDISSIPYGTGVSHYTTNLVRALIKQFPQHSFVLFGASLRRFADLVEFAAQFPTTKSVILPFPPTLMGYLFNRAKVPIETFTGPLDIFHAWDWYIPRTRHAKLITTIHDLTALKYTDETHPAIVAHHRQSITTIEKYADAVIAVSNATKADCLQLTSIENQKITVIPEALPDELIHPIKQSDSAHIEKKFAIQKPYYIAVASQEKRKNLNRTIKAFEPLADTHQLVLVGKSGYDTIKDAAYIVKTGYVVPKELAALYAGAEGLLYCSLYEGFGLPILEAFHYGIPVITSNTSSMPEVGGDAVVYIDPADTASITNGIKKAIKNKSELVAKGKNQLQKFSWEATAHKTMSAYEKTMNKQ